MIVLPNYLYNFILKYIINHIYIYTLRPLVNDNEKFYLFRAVSNNEVINLSLVSTTFFQICSNLLSECINYDNYYIMKPLINDAHIFGGGENRNDIGKFKLLSLNRDQIIKVYESFELYNHESKNLSESYYGNFRKVIITISSEEDFELIETRLDEFPDNFEFNIYLTEYPHFIQLEKLGTNLTNMNTIYIYSDSTYFDQDKTDELFQKLFQLNPKRLINDTLGAFSITQNLVMKSIGSLESLKILRVSNDPIGITNLKNASKLKELSFVLDLNKYFGIINNK